MITSAEIDLRFEDVLENQCGPTEERKWDNDKSFRENGLDSLEGIEIMLAMDEEFGRTFDVEEDLIWDMTPNTLKEAVRKQLTETNDGT